MFIFGHFSLSEATFDFKNQSGAARNLQNEPLDSVFRPLGVHFGDFRRGGGRPSGAGSEFLKFGFLQNSSRLVFSCSKSDPAENFDIDKFFEDRFRPTDDRFMPEILFLGSRPGPGQIHSFVPLTPGREARAPTQTREGKVFATFAPNN